jgi:hypothetical protein
MPARVFGSVVAAAVVAIVLVGWQAMDTRGPGTTEDASAGRHAGTLLGQPRRAIPAGVFPGLDSLFATEIPLRPKVAVPIGAENFDTMFTAPEQEAVIDFMNEHRIREPSVRY